MGEADPGRQELLAWLALGLWTVLILLAAGDAFSAANTQSWTGQAPRSAPIPFTHMLTRIGMHVVLYGIFGGLAYRALEVSAGGRGGFPAVVGAVLMAFLIGFADESIQSAHPNRSGSARDVVLNMVGSAMGATLVVGLAGAWQRRTREPT